MGRRSGEYTMVTTSSTAYLTRQACSGKAFGMKDYRKTHQERENKPNVQCHLWYIVHFSLRGNVADHSTL